MRLAAAFAFSGLLASTDALAFIDQPVFTPNPVIAGQEFFVSMRHGHCDFFPSIEFPIDIEMVPPNRVQLFVSGYHLTNPILCNAPISSPLISMRPLAAGVYNFELYIRNRGSQFMPIYAGPTAILNVVARPDLAVAVPSMGYLAMFALMLSLMVAGVCGRQK
jgi:hypothetical protein